MDYFKKSGYICSAICSDISSCMSVNGGRKYDDIICEAGATYCHVL